jgi:GNAT superfamily N-acetyltransferase
MNYIRNSWCRSSHSHLESAHYLSNQGPPPPFPLYRELFDDTIDRILRNSTALVAVNDDDDDQILGFIVFEASESATVLHYIQVKKELWRKGIARALLSTAGITDAACFYSFSSPIIGKLRHDNKWPAKWAHVPHWLLERS